MLRVIHGTQVIEIHVLAPFLCVPYFLYDTVLRNLRINMDELSSLRICPVLIKWRSETVLVAEGIKRIRTLAIIVRGSFM
jgi:hypothetical protein